MLRLSLAADLTPAEIYAVAKDEIKPRLEQVQSVATRYFGDDALTVATLLPQPLDKTRKPRVAPAGARH